MPYFLYDNIVSIGLKPGQQGGDDELYSAEKLDVQPNHRKETPANRMPLVFAILNGIGSKTFPNGGSPIFRPGNQPVQSLFIRVFGYGRLPSRSTIKKAGTTIFTVDKYAGKWKATMERCHFNR